MAVELKITVDEEVVYAQVVRDFNIAQENWLSGNIPLVIRRRVARALRRKAREEEQWKKLLQA
jgi:hypothetical protein